MPVVEQDQNLKQLMKEAVKEGFKEALAENGEVFREMISEVLEDMAMLERMEEGLKTDFISEAEVMALLKEYD